MRTITLYTFEELSPEAQKKAIDDYADRLSYDEGWVLLETEESLQNDNELAKDLIKYRDEFLEDGTIVNLLIG